MIMMHFCDLLSYLTCIYTLYLRWGGLGWIEYEKVEEDFAEK